MIKYIRGNLLDATQSIIVHQVNCQGVMGSGVALAIKMKWPKVYEDYKDLGIPTDGRDILGEIQLIRVSKDLEVCNLFSQDQYLPRGKRHTSYDAIEVGLRSLKALRKGDIAMPKIGCGLGGGDWKIVSAVIESVFDDRIVYIYEL